MEEGFLLDFTTITKLEMTIFPKGMCFSLIPVKAGYIKMEYLFPIPAWDPCNSWSMQKEEPICFGQSASAARPWDILPLSAKIVTRMCALKIWARSPMQPIQCFKILKMDLKLIPHPLSISCINGHSLNQISYTMLPPMPLSLQAKPLSLRVISIITISNFVTKMDRRLRVGATSADMRG